jgi:hypothetical protein
MALTTTLMTSPILQWLLRRDPWVEPGSVMEPAGSPAVRV